MSLGAELSFPFSMPQGDLVVRTALQAAFADMRSQPWLLEFALSFLVADPLTRQEYGQKELDRCLNWFLANDVRIAAGWNIEDVEVPHIALWPGQQSEGEAIMGDINDTQYETIRWPQPAQNVVGFTPVGFDAQTGIIIVPAEINTENIFIGDLIFSRTGSQGFSVTDIQGQQISIELPAGQPVPVLNQVVVRRPRQGTMMVSLESITTRDSYQLDVVAPGDATLCVALHSLTLFALYRYKQDLLEARGFERSEIVSTPLNGLRSGQQSVQFMYQRGITITGYVRTFWPKRIGQPIAGIVPVLRVPGGAESDPAALDAGGPRLWTSISEAADDDGN